MIAPAHFSGNKYAFKKGKLVKVVAIANRISNKVYGKIG